MDHRRSEFAQLSLEDSRRILEIAQTATDDLANDGFYLAAKSWSDPEEAAKRIAQAYLPRQALTEKIPRKSTWKDQPAEKVIADNPQCFAIKFPGHDQVILASDNPQLFELGLRDTPELNLSSYIIEDFPFGNLIYTVPLTSKGTGRWGNASTRLRQALGWEPLTVGQVLQYAVGHPPVRSTDFPLLVLGTQWTTLDKDGGIRRAYQDLTGPHSLFEIQHTIDWHLQLTWDKDKSYWLGELLNPVHIAQSKTPAWNVLFHGEDRSE